MGEKAMWTWISLEKDPNEGQRCHSLQLVDYLYLQEQLSSMFGGDINGYDLFQTLRSESRAVHRPCLTSFNHAPYNAREAKIIKVVKSPPRAHLAPFRSTLSKILSASVADLALL